MKPQTLARCMPIGIPVIMFAAIYAVESVAAQAPDAPLQPDANPIFHRNTTFFRTGPEDSRAVPVSYMPDSDAREYESNRALPAFFTPQVRAWEEDIFRWAEGFGLDPNLVATVMQIESCGDPHAVSPSGAQGLFQVMPYHFSAGEEMQDPETNARRGLAYLAESLVRSRGDADLALAGYNGGHGVIDWDPGNWPDETKGYVYWGGGIYADASAGLADSPRLEEWLAAGGASLCKGITE
jgi:hypothetical protein